MFGLGEGIPAFLGGMVVFLLGVGASTNVSKRLTHFLERGIKREHWKEMGQ